MTGAAAAPSDRLTAVLSVAVILIGPMVNNAWGCDPQVNLPPVSGVEIFDLSTSNQQMIDGVESANSVWAGCSEWNIISGRDIPEIAANHHNPDISWDLDFYDQRSLSSACAQPNPVTHTLEIYRENFWGDPCHCNGDYGPTIAHEIGHIFG